MCCTCVASRQSSFWIEIFVDDVSGNDNEFYPLLVKKKQNRENRSSHQVFLSLETLIVHRVWVKGLIG